MSQRFFFPKSARLCTRRQYQRISQQPTRHFGQWLVIESRHNKFNSIRLGITVSRKYGKAVQRNRFKRIVREGFRLCRHKLSHPLDINVRPRHGAGNATSKDIEQELLKLLNNKGE